MRIDLIITEISFYCLDFRRINNGTEEFHSLECNQFSLVLISHFPYHPSKGSSGPSGQVHLNENVNI